MDFSVTTNWLGVAFFGIVLLILGLIFVARAIMAGKSSQNLSQKHGSGPEKSVLDIRNKYPEVDVFQFSSTFFNSNSVQQYHTPLLFHYRVQPPYLIFFAV